MVTKAREIACRLEGGDSQFVLLISLEADLSQFGRRSIKRVHLISYVISPGVCALIAHICSCYHYYYSVSIRFRLRRKALRSVRSEP